MGSLSAGPEMGRRRLAVSLEGSRVARVGLGKGAIDWKTRSQMLVCVCMSLDYKVSGPVVPVEVNLGGGGEKRGRDINHNEEQYTYNVVIQLSEGLIVLVVKNRRKDSGGDCSRRGRRLLHT